MKSTMYKGIVAFAAALLIMGSCKDTGKPAEQDAETTTTPVPAVISYSIVKEYPHDPHCFTEGLEYVDGDMFESAGQYGSSDIRRVSLETGKVTQQQKLDPKYFGEGITVLNGNVYQLTYKEHTGFVYDQKTLKLLQTFSFANNEGWGMTNDGTNLIMSDGTDELTFLDATTLKETRRIKVRDQYGPVDRINELEYVKGNIYANVWTQDVILKIDAQTGLITGRIDLSMLRQQAGIPQPTAGDEDAPEVMNGIAYDAAQNRFFITGKNWPKLFEVKLGN